MNNTYFFSIYSVLNHVKTLGFEIKQEVLYKHIEVTTDRFRLITNDYVRFSNIEVLVKQLAIYDNFL